MRRVLMGLAIAGVAFGAVLWTKGFGPEAVRAALEAGLNDVGENYAKELVDKAAQIDQGSSPRWQGKARPPTRSRPSSCSS